MSILQWKSKRKLKPMLACKLVKEFVLKENQKIVSKNSLLYIDGVPFNYLIGLSNVCQGATLESHQ